MIRRPVRRRSQHRFVFHFIKFLGVILIPFLLIIFEIQPISDLNLNFKQTKKSIETLTQNVELNARSFLMADSQTGQIIYQKNQQQSLPIASISKIIPTYFVYEALQKGQIHMDDQVSVDPKVAALSTQAGLSNVKLKANSTYSVRDLIYATLLSSANAGIMALSAYLAPLPIINQREDTFLRNLGINNFVIVNVNGLPNDMLGSLRNPETDLKADNQMSAVDVAAVASRLVNDFPKVLEVSEHQDYIFKSGTSEEQKLENTNMLVKGGSLADPNLAVEGLKTGTNDQGYSFVGIMKDGKSLITSVVLNSNSNEARFQQTKEYLQQFKKNYHLVKINPQTNNNVKNACLTFKKQYDRTRVQTNFINLWVPNNLTAADFHFKVDFDRNYFAKTKKPGLILTLDLPTNAVQFLKNQDLKLYLR